MFGRLQALWKRRELVLALAARDLQLRYKGSVLGVLWSLMHPLILAAVYLVAFQFFLRIQIPHYPLFLLAGILPWLFFSSAVIAGTTAVTDQGHLVKKLSFPREALPLAVVVAQFVHFAIAYLVVVPGLTAWQVGIGPAAIAVPVVMVLLGLFACGVALMTATAQVYLRDTRHLLEVLLQVWFWITPIVYSLQVGQLERYRPWFALNPLFAFVSAFRSLLLDGRLPGAGDAAWLVALTTATFLAGFAVFANGQRHFAEHV